MQVYVCCPPRGITGGIELLQQLVHELNRQCPGLAKVLYIDNTPEEGWQVCPQYVKYGNPFTVNTCTKDAVIILPEIWAAMAETRFKGWPCIIWWESVNNYFRTTPREEWYGFARDKSLRHMTQSMYAKGFLLGNAGVSEDRIIEVSDYLGESFLERDVKLKAYGRRPRVLYNTAKGLEFTKQLIEASPQLEWTPIKGMSEEEVAALMSESRVYVDFGDHPGKDRMPREAAVSGCCVVTGRDGSASYYEDVPIGGDYKFERRESNIPAICSRIEQLLNGYDRYITDFEYYRSVIRGEKKKFEEAVRGLIQILQREYSFVGSEDRSDLQEASDNVVSIVECNSDHVSMAAGNKVKRKDYSASEEMAKAVEEAMALLRQNPGLVAVAGQILDRGMRMVYGELFGNPQVKAGVFPGQRELSEVRRDADGLAALGEAWLVFVRQILARRKSAPNALDEAFYAMMDRVRCVEEWVILGQVRAMIQSYHPEHLQRLNTFYEKLGYMWGALDTNANEYQVVENRIRVMAGHWAEMERVYERLLDYRSKKVLYHTLSSWLTYDRAEMFAMYENNFEAYWDLDLVSCGEDEVFVDLGAYTGDSVQSYIDTYGAWKRIYAYEMMEDNFQQMQKNLQGYENIVMVRKAVAEKPGRMYIDEGIDFTDSHRLADSGQDEVEVTTLDEDIKEKITLIKLDIEGAEKDALLGARRHIQEEKPKLLVSVYHNNEDIWKIPGMLLEMREDYRFYLRSNGIQYGPVDMVLFAV